MEIGGSCLVLRKSQDGVALLVLNHRCRFEFFVVFHYAFCPFDHSEFLQRGLRFGIIAEPIFRPVELHNNAFRDGFLGSRWFVANKLRRVLLLFEKNRLDLSSRIGPDWEEGLFSSVYSRRSKTHLWLF